MTPRFTTRSILFLAAVTMAAAPAVAQGYGPGGGMDMGNPDAPWRQRFAAIAPNSDGRISKTEMSLNAEAVFAAMDENRDGKVDRAEFLHGAAMRFTSADRNRDGTVTPLELRARAW